MRILYSRHKGPHRLVVLDEAAGLPDRYTVYEIPGAPSGKFKILGRELPPEQAFKVARKRRSQ